MLGALLIPLACKEDTGGCFSLEVFLIIMPYRYPVVH